MMDPEIKRLWVDALRSGEYEQGKTFLFVDAEEAEAGASARYCCLGVLCAIQGVDWKKDFKGLTTMTKQLPRGFAAGLTGTQMGALADLNDSGKTFKQIADVLERWTGATLQIEL